MDGKPIGTVTFDIDGSRTATLHADRSWTIEPALDEFRQTVFLAYLADLSDAYTGPQDGFFGGPQLRQAAAYLKGKVTSEPTPPDDDEGTVY